MKFLNKLKKWLFGNNDFIEVKDFENDVVFIKISEIRIVWNDPESGNTLIGVKGLDLENSWLHTSADVNDLIKVITENTESSIKKVKSKEDKQKQHEFKVLDFKNDKPAPTISTSNSEKSS